MTDISVVSTAYQVENRSWFLGTADNPGFTTSVLLDVSAFTAATHYPDGFFKSGLAVAKITAQSTGTRVVVGPYDNAAVDGRGECYGLLFSSVRVPNPANPAVDVAGAILVAFAAVKLARLPIALDAPGQADLTRLYFVA